MGLSLLLGLLVFQFYVLWCIGLLLGALINYDNVERNPVESEYARTALEVQYFKV
jgi:hypothetical protein